MPGMIISRGGARGCGSPWERLDKVSHLPPVFSLDPKDSVWGTARRKNKNIPPKSRHLKKGLAQRTARLWSCWRSEKQTIVWHKSRPWQWLHALHLTSQGSTDNNSVATVFFSKYLGRKFLHPTSRKKRKLRENGDVQIYANLSKNPWFPSCHKGTLSQTVSCDLVWHEPN